MIVLFEFVQRSQVTQGLRRRYELPTLSRSVKHCMLKLNFGSVALGTLLTTQKSLRQEKGSVGPLWRELGFGVFVGFRAGLILVQVDAVMMVRTGSVCISMLLTCPDLVNEVLSRFQNCVPQQRDAPQPMSWSSASRAACLGAAVLCHVCRDQRHDNTTDLLAPHCVCELTATNSSRKTSRCGTVPLTLIYALPQGETAGGESCRNKHWLSSRRRWTSKTQNASWSKGNVEIRHRAGRGRGVEGRCT